MRRFFMAKVKYPKPRVERKEGSNNTDTDAKKYQNIVKSHPVEVTAVTKREKRLKELRLEEKKTEEQLEKQKILARLKGMVKKW